LASGIRNQIIVDNPAFRQRATIFYAIKEASKISKTILNLFTSTFLKPVFFICFLLVVPFNLSSAQSYYFRHYQVENGLSNNTVYCCMQDKKGFLWFGTKDGLNRFDGYTFKTFRHNAKDNSSVANNVIHTLYLDKANNLWVGTEQGLDKYNLQTENFTHVYPTNTNAVRSIIKDHNDNCWFISGWSLIKYNERTGKITDFTSLQHFDATSIVENNNGTLWVSSTTGTLEKLDTVSNTFKSYSVFKNSKRVASNFIEKIYLAGDDKIFIGTSDEGFKLFNCITGDYKDILTYNQDKTEIYVRDFIKYSDDEYWIATESGIFIYNVGKDTFINLKKHYNDPYSVSDNAIYTLYKDIEGGVWAGTYFGGVNYYPKPYSTFNKFYPGADKNSIKGNVVREICKDRYGNLWLGTEDNGLNKLSADKRRWTHYSTGVNNGLSNTNVHGLLANGRELFIGTFERGLDILDIPTGKVVRHYLAGKGKHDLKSNFIVCFCKTRSGIILIGTTRGLYRYNTISKDFTLIDKIPPNDFIYSMLEDHKGNVWAGTVHDGIYSYDPGNNVSSKLKNSYPVKNALNINTVDGIFEDSNKNLWFATEGLGLWKYNPQKKLYKFYDSKNGLPSNYVFRILEDSHKNLWISTTRGLVCLNIINDDITIYTKANGLLSDQFNYSSAFRDADSTMYFGCVKGLVSFNPSQFKRNNFISPVYITGFQVNNKEVFVNGPDSLLNKSIICTSRINLNYNQSSFNIDFAALGYSSPEMTQYKYQMAGLDKGWTYLKTNRKVYFTQLSPGHYTFIVKAANNNVSWNKKETRLEINITPSFWESLWAYTTYTALSLLSMFYLLRRYHFKTREKNKRIIEQLEHDKERQIYNAKIEFFTNVAHEIRTPLTLIKGPMEKVIKKAESVPEIQNNLKIMEKNTNRLLDLTNQLLDFRKTETNEFSLNFVKADITELLKDLFLQFKPMAEQKNLTYRFKHSDKQSFAYVDTEAFTKIISNLLNNAIKYGDSIVEVKLLELIPDDGKFSVEIKNDGYLIPYKMREKIFEPFFRIKESEKQIGTGIGLSLSRSLTELHKGVLVLNKSVSEFNIFTLTLPVHQDKGFDLFNTMAD